TYTVNIHRIAKSVISPSTLSANQFPLHSSLCLTKRDNFAAYWIKDAPRNPGGCASGVNFVHGDDAEISVDNLTNLTEFDLEFPITRCPIQRMEIPSCCHALKDCDKVFRESKSNFTLLQRNMSTMAHVKFEFSRENSTDWFRMNFLRISWIEVFEIEEITVTLSRQQCGLQFLFLGNLQLKNSPIYIYFI